MPDIVSIMPLSSIHGGIPLSDQKAGASWIIQIVRSPWERLDGFHHQIYAGHEYPTVDDIATMLFL